jgi:translation initiation factor 4E
MAASSSSRPSLRPGGSTSSGLTGNAKASVDSAPAGPVVDENETPFFSLNPKITPQKAKALSPPLSAAALEEVKKTNPKLSATWTIWEQLVVDKTKMGSYGDATRQLVNFDTAKDFWACWNHLPQPSELLDGKKFTREKDGQKIVVDSLMIFRKGIQPEWEDPANKQGGHFEIKLKPALGAGVMDELWNNIVLGMVTGAIEPAEMLNGVRLVDKLKAPMPMVRIEVWFNDMDADDTGRLYKLRGSFERCMRTSLNGEERVVSWGYTQTKSHSGEETAPRQPRAPRGAR